MQRGLLGSVAALVVLAAAILVAPNFIDWNGYRDLLAGQLSSALGREVIIAGDMDAALLPRPAFKAAEIRIGPAGSEESITIEALDARLAFMPLLAGRLQLRELVLVRPDARIAQTDGSTTPDSFLDVLSRRTLTSAAPSSEGNRAPFVLAVENINIEDGAVQVHGSALDNNWNLTGINASINIAARGAIAATGTMSVRGTPMVVDATYTPVNAANADGVNISVQLVEAEATIKFIGTVNRTSERDIRGDVSVSGSSSRALLAVAGLAGPQSSLPESLLRPIVLTAKVSGASGNISTKNLVADFGGTGASGAVAWTGGAVPNLDVDLEFTTIELEKWNFSSAYPAMPPSGTRFVDLGDIFRRAYAADEGGEGLRFPQSLTASLHVRAPILSYGDDVLRDGVINISLLNGQLAVHEVGVTLPGATQVRAFGFIQDGAIPIFDGALELDTQNLRGTLTWLGIEEALEQVPRGRLSQASLRTAVQGTPARLSFGDITATIDTASATGSAFFGLSERTAFGVDLTVDALNLDTYVPVLTDKGLRALFSGGTDDDPRKADVYGVTPVLDSLKSLANFDADVRVAVNALTAGSIPNGRVGLDFGLKGGVLDIRSASFDNVAGATIWFSGSLAGFGTTPQFQGFQFDLHTDDLGRFGRAFGVGIPSSIRKLAPVSLTGVVNGGLSQADLVATAKIGGMTIQGVGQGLSLDLQPHLTLALDVSHPSFGKFMQSSGFTWPTGSTDPGLVSLTARLAQSGTLTTIDEFKLSIGREHLVGRVIVSNAADKPHISATFSDVAVAFDELWPKDPTQQFSGPARSSSSEQGPGAVSSIWSDDPFDWSALAEWNGDVTVSGSRLNIRGVDVRDFNSTITIADGAAEISQWSGYLFGARGELSLRAIAVPEPSLQGNISFAGGDFASVAAAINGGGSTGLNPNAGEVDFTGAFTAAGASPRALIESLSGNGTFTLHTASVGTGVAAGLLGAVSAAAQAESIVPGGQNTPVSVEAKLMADKGRIEIVDGALKSRSYGGAFLGVIDLPNWLVDVSGRLRLEKLPRADAATQRTLPASVPITVRGRLDLPNIILEPS